MALEFDDDDLFADNDDIFGDNSNVEAAPKENTKTQPEKEKHKKTTGGSINKPLSKKIAIGL